MSLSDIVSVTITSETAGVRQAGFGIPLILSVNAAFSERVRFYTKAADLLTDGFSATDPEYLAATALLGQTNKVQSFALGRCALKPTMRYKITVKSVANSTTYSVRAGAETATVISDTDATNEEVVDLLVDALNGTSIAPCLPAGWTASKQGTGGSAYCRVVATSAGDWLALEAADPDLLTLEMDHADPGVATDLAAILVEDSTWYGVCNPFNSTAMATAIATWVEANEKLFVCASCDGHIITSVLAGATDIAAACQTSAYARTAVIYHPAPDDFADAAWLGKCLPLTPGSETWKFKTLAGVAATSLTTTHFTNAKNKAANVYQTIAGVNITDGTPGGTVAAGEFIDVVRFRDWLRARIAERVYGLLVRKDKVPYTDSGIGMVKTEVQGALLEGVDNGGLASDPAPTVTVPRAADCSANDKSLRKLTDVEFTGTLAGAIHNLEIAGTLTL